MSAKMEINRFVTVLCTNRLPTRLSFAESRTVKGMWWQKTTGHPSLSKTTWSQKKVQRFASLPNYLMGSNSFICGSEFSEILGVLNDVLKRYKMGVSIWFLSSVLVGAMSKPDMSVFFIFLFLIPLACSLQRPLEAATQIDQQYLE